MTQLSPETRPLYSRLAADPDLAEIVQLFVDEMPNRISQLLDRLEAADWEGLRYTAHQLKGAAGSYGFDPISPSAATVENAIRDGLPEEQIRDATDALLELCRRARGGRPE